MRGFHFMNIKNGKIVASTDKDNLPARCRIVKGSVEQLTEELAGKLLKRRKHDFGLEGMIRAEDLPAVSLRTFWKYPGSMTIYDAVPLQKFMVWPRL